jgi:hypothetical protein
LGRQRHDRRQASPRIEALPHPHRTASKEKMMHRRLLKDRRVETALTEVKKETGHPFLDILAIVFEHLPEILMAINNPKSLISLIIRLLPKKGSTS